MEKEEEESIEGGKGCGGQHVRSLPRHFVTSTQLRRLGHPSKTVLTLSFCSAANIPVFARDARSSPRLIVSCRWYLPARPITDPALHTRRGANDSEEEKEEMEEKKKEKEEEVKRAELQLQLSSQVGMRAGEDKACRVGQPAEQSGTTMQLTDGER